MIDQPPLDNALKVLRKPLEELAAATQAAAWKVWRQLLGRCDHNNIAVSTENRCTVPVGQLKHVPRGHSRYL